MKKNLSMSFLMAAFAFLAFSGVAMAKQDILAVDGVYNVPGHPDMNVRVFVHKAKPIFGKNTQNELVCSDPGSIAVVKSAGWKLPNTTWKYYVNSESAKPFVGSSFVPIADFSFDAWKIGTDLPTTFEYAGDTNIDYYDLDGQNILTWGVAPSNALAVTYTWYNRKTKMVVENDTIMNKAFAWSWSSYPYENCGITGTFDAQNILTHELGHWVGLNDHYTAAYANNTMFGYGSPAEVKKDTLTNGDISGVNKIY